MYYRRSIGLQFYIMILICAIAALCLMSTVIFILYQNNLEYRTELSTKAELMDKHLELQLLKENAGYQGFQNFPELNIGQNEQQNAGYCLQYKEINGNILRNICYGGRLTSKNWPAWFSRYYQWVFYPANEIVRLITYKSQSYGTLVLTPDVDVIIGRAWHDVKKLMNLFTVTLFSLCVLLYFFLGWALKPAKDIVSCLENMRQGDLSIRISDFSVEEWQNAGRAINQLAAQLEKTLDEKDKLMFKLFNVQEEERRFLTRELHDEFGQCLAGQQATAFSMSQTAKQKCHELVDDCQTLIDTNSLMMGHLSNMLQQFHPSNIDQIGLTTSLNNLISGWNARSSGKTQYKIEIEGNVRLIPVSVSSHVFRIIQECLTNIAKHSEAKYAKVELSVTTQDELIHEKTCADAINIIISDDGQADSKIILDSCCKGLLGIRERIIILGGKIKFTTNTPSGLILQICIPFQSISNAQN